jgi:undecaprenyl-diphosphatase
LTVVVTRRALPPDIDTWWAALVGGVRSPLLDGIALTFNVIGSGLVARVIIPLVAVAVLLARRRVAPALYLIVATVISGVVVGVLKNIVARDRPTDGLVAVGFGSFPSGHAANAAVLTVALALLLRRGWVWWSALALTVLMMLSRTYLGVHWLTDTIGGALLGAATAAGAFAAYEVLHRRRISQAADSAGTDPRGR